MSDTTPQLSSSPAPERIRPLGARPNLEYEHKAAKHLLRDALAGEPGALARLAALRREDADTHDWQLADAQRVIAREYGFSSWPKLVSYYATWERHEKSQPRRATYGPGWYNDRVRQALDAHQARHWSIAPTLAAYVPRHFGKSDDEIFATPLTEPEAQLAVARRDGFASWAALLDAAAKVTEKRDREFQDSTFGKAHAAINAADFETLKAVVLEHPELLQPAASGLAEGMSIISSAMLFERTSRSAVAREMTDWLAGQGADLQGVLNRSLIGGMRATADDFEYLIARGADPAWVPANGISLLEHLLLRCWGPGPADVLARYVTPRKAFWIAAGMNDVEQMRSYFNRDGTLTDAAHNDRPDFTAVQAHMLTRPGVGDQDVMWEASIVAGFNRRWDTFDLLIAHGLPIDYSPWKFNLLHWAVGNGIVDVVEALVARGVDLDVKGWHPYASAREMAASNYESQPMRAQVKRIYEICCSEANPRSAPDDS